jgi:ubiquinone/menaquinone biosynthesis C-methylase UbiE
VGFYSRVIFPWLCDFTLGTPAVGDERRQLLAKAEGDILEIGFGTGLNLPHYPAHVRQITAIDPNLGMKRLAQKRARESDVAVDHRTLSGEQLPFDECAFDCVVSTFTLCSVATVDHVLSELCRVLRPGGRFLFLEHGQSPEPAVRSWQRRLNRLQMLLGEGCRLDRNMRDLVASQPWAALETTEFYLQNTPKTHGYLYRGTATK